MERSITLTRLQKILCLIRLKVCRLLRMVLWQIFILQRETRQVRLTCSMIRTAAKFPVMQETIIHWLHKDHSNWNRAAMDLLFAIQFTWKMQTDKNISGDLRLLSCAFLIFFQTQLKHFRILDMNIDFLKKTLPGVTIIKLFISQMVKWLLLFLMNLRLEGKNGDLK